MIFTWWMWLMFGFLLLVIELITPGGFFIFFFGVGAIIVGLCALLGIAGPPAVQWLAFAILSGGLLAAFRKPLQQKLRHGPSHEVDAIKGQTAVATESIPAGGTGKVELRGSTWSARNNGDEAVAAGQRCRVERVEGLILHIRG